MAPSGGVPADLEQTQPTCGAPTAAANTGGPLLAQVLCDTGFGSCPAGAHYPPATTVVMHPLPGNLPTMPIPARASPPTRGVRTENRADRPTVSSPVSRGER